MIIKENFEGSVGDYCIARNTIKCLLIMFNMLCTCITLMRKDIIMIITSFSSIHRSIVFQLLFKEIVTICKILLNIRCLSSSKITYY